MKDTIENDAAASIPPQKKLWRAGTLTYTTGGLVLLGIYLLGGDFPWALKDRAVMPSATILIKQIGVSEFVYGLIIISFPNFTNIFLSPIISYMSDRHRGRFGRRIPFLMFTTPFIVLGLYLLGLTRILGTALHEAIPDIPLNTSMLIFFGIAWVLLDFGTTLSSSLFNALANDVVPREVLGRFFGLFRMLSLGAGMIFNAWIIDKVEQHILPIFIVIGTLYGFGLLLLCFKVKEGEYPPPPVEQPLSDAGHDSVVTKVFSSVVTYFRQSFSLSYYRWFMLAVAIASTSFSSINYFSIQYAKSIGLGMDKYGMLLVITYTFSLIASYTFGAISDRFHPLRCGITALIAYLLLMGVSWFLMADAKYFSPIFVLHGIISGSYMTLTASLAARIYPQALFAQFISAFGIISAICSLVFAPVVGALLDMLGHDYRYLFLFAGIVTIAGILLMIKVYRNFLAQGGHKEYQPPMPT